MRGYCNCELCGKRARTYCESDKAKLCWDCDQKVHGANFLVAKHSRCLLCHACQSPTPWKASGPKLLPTVSFCEECVGNHRRSGEQDGEVDNQYQLGHASSEDDDNNNDGEDSSSSDYEEEGDDGSEEEGDNQVVPLVLDATASSPAHVLSCSHSEEETSSSVGTSDLSFKRFRNNSANTNCSDEEIGSGSSLQTLSMTSPSSKASPMRYLRPLKRTRRTEF